MTHSVKCTFTHESLILNFSFSHFWIAHIVYSSSKAEGNNVQIFCEAAQRDAETKKRWQMERGMMRTSVSGKQPPCCTIPSAVLDKGCTCLLIVHMFRLPGRSSLGAVRGRESVPSTSGNWAFIQMIIQTAVREQINRIQVGLRSPESMDRPTPSSFVVPHTVLERCPLWYGPEISEGACKSEQSHPKLSHYRLQNFANVLSAAHFNPRFEMLTTHLL